MSEAVTQTTQMHSQIYSQQKAQHVPAVLRTTTAATAAALGGEELSGAAELLGLGGRMHVHDLDHAL